MHNKKEWDLAIHSIWMDLESIILSKLSQRRQKIPYDFTPMWNLRNKTNDHMGRGKKRIEGNKPQETLNHREQTEGWWKEVSGGWAGWVVAIKEGTCCDGYWVLPVSDESLNCTPETNIALYVS